MTSAPDSTWIPFKSSIYILGAGFSVAAGLPTAAELWKEVLTRALPMKGRAEKFREDLGDYIEFKHRAEGASVTIETVDFEEFLGFLDVEHYLGLRGSETWSDAGNESQVIVRTLIGQILTERTPKPTDIPELYLDFVRKLQPHDRIYTFNYDIILERACEIVGQRYRLFPNRSGDVRQHPEDEVAILKLHGSLDWFSRKTFRTAIEYARLNGFDDFIPTHPVFDQRDRFDFKAIKEPCNKEDELYDIYRVIDIERFYRKPSFSSWLHFY